MEHLAAGAVGDDHQHVRQRGLLQRGAEGADQRVRQLADEADRIRQQIGGVLGGLHAAADCVQRGKELILCVHVCAGHGVEQGGLAGVGIAHQRHHGHVVLFAALAAQSALLLHRVQTAAQLGHALADTAAVHFQLAFAGAAGADAAGQTAQHQTLTDQPGGLVLQLCQRDLQLALRAGCALGEDVQNQRGAVHHLHA